MDEWEREKGLSPRSGRSPRVGVQGEARDRESLGVASHGPGRAGSGMPAAKGNREGRGCTSQGKSSLQKPQQNKAQKGEMHLDESRNACCVESVVLSGRTGSGG